MEFLCDRRATPLVVRCSSAMGGVILIDSGRQGRPARALKSPAFGCTQGESAAVSLGKRPRTKAALPVGHFFFGQRDRASNDLREWTMPRALAYALTENFEVGATFAPTQASTEEPGLTDCFLPGAVNAQNYLGTILPKRA